MKRRALVVLATAACWALATGATMAGPAQAATSARASAATAMKAGPAAAQPPAGHLGAAMPVPGLKALNVGGNAEVSAVRCPSPGSCTAAGDYIDGKGKHQAFVATEASFTWHNAIPVPGLAAINNGGPTNITSLSCPSAGECEIGGWFVDPAGNLQPFVAREAHGTFGKALALFTIDDQISQFIGRVNAVSCATPGNCTAALSLPVSPPGGGAQISQAFLITETNGNWGPLRGVPGISGSGTSQPSGIGSVSCWKPGDCLAVGGSGDTGSLRPFLATQIGGSWSSVNTIPGLNSPSVVDFNPNADAAGVQVSCWAFTSCTVAGIYGDHHGNQQLFVADWTGGEWATQTLPGSAELNVGGLAGVNGLSCGSAGNCAVAGQFLNAPQNDPSAQFHALVDSRAGGNWGNAQEILGISNLPDSNAVAASCPATGSCVTGGNYTAAGHQQAYVSFENTIAGTSDVGTFGGAQQVAGNLNAGGSAGVNDISCASAGECAIGGFYADANNKQQGFIVTRSARTATSLTLSAARVKLGHEQAEHLSVKVTPRGGGTPTGKITVKAGSATVCTITLAKAKGTCSLKARQLRRGTYHLTAAYHGSQAYAASTSAKKTLTVTK